MKQLNNFISLITLLCFSMTGFSQWDTSSTGNTAGVTHCFIETSGILLSGGNGASIFSSTNNGNTWTLSNSGINSGDEIVCLGKNSAGVFAGGNQIYFSNNNGALWIPVNNNGNTTFGFAFLTDTVFAATMGGGVIMSTNNGSSWTNVNSGITTLNVYSIIKKGNLLFAGTANNGIFVSSNSGASWTAANTGLPSPVTVRCLETDGINIYTGTSDFSFPSVSHGMFISSNNGTSWTQVTNGISTSDYVFGITNLSFV